MKLYFNDIAFARTYTCVYQKDNNKSKVTVLWLVSKVQYKIFSEFTCNSSQAPTSSNTDAFILASYQFLVASVPWYSETCHVRQPLLKDQIFLAGQTFQFNVTEPVTKDHLS